MNLRTKQTIIKLDFNTLSMTTFKDLFNDHKKLIVPSYQRAYSWEKEQAEQFLSDLKDTQSTYYFGHFILEENGDVNEIIDGQQRITTSVLFLIACQKILKTNVYNSMINGFETCNYDQPNYVKLVTNHHFQLPENANLSLNNIKTTLNYFENELNSKDVDVRKLVDKLLDAEISIHKTKGKGVAAQIFELHNSRGLKLNVIEKVKAKLMKAIYLNLSKEEANSTILKIQDNFAILFEKETALKNNAFKGSLSLETLLYHHLRIVDDGSKIDVLKLDLDKNNYFNLPKLKTNIEQTILSYLDEQIKSKEENGPSIVNYIVNLIEKFKQTVCFFSDDLPKIDNKNKLIGDVIILEKKVSIEFFILLHHLNIDLIDNNEFLKQWEKFLFTQDFHALYHGKWYKENFQKLFKELAEKKGTSTDNIFINEHLETYLKKGFRNEFNDDLQGIVKKYIEENNRQIKTNAYYWHRKKMFYLLYKYEVSIGANQDNLREIIKNSFSVEHILPVEWSKEWLKVENFEEMKVKVNEHKNGIGNLILITSSLNSSLSNNHPAKKSYTSICKGGTYENHESQKDMWNDTTDWVENIINARSEEILKFLNEFLEYV